MAGQSRTSATGSPYRWTSVAATAASAELASVGLSRLEEKQSLLGGRMSNVARRWRLDTLFLDAEARHDFGSGWSAALTARRGWTDFAAGKFQTGAYAFDVAKFGLLGERPARLPSRAAASGRAWRLRDVAADGLRLFDRDRDRLRSARCRSARAAARSMRS